MADPTPLELGSSGSVIPQHIKMESLNLAVASTISRDTERQRQALDLFLRSAQARAFRRAEIASGSSTDAQDIVQNAMVKLAEKYGHSDAADWPALFHRIVQNCIRDWHRRQALRSGWRWLKGDAQDEAVNNYAVGRQPLETTEQTEALEALELALQSLPQRQQQVFLLRSWEGLNVNEAAEAMGCSAGSVKTHYSRALSKLREQLGDHQL